MRAAISGREPIVIVVPRDVDIRDAGLKSAYCAELVGQSDALLPHQIRFSKRCHEQRYADNKQGCLRSRAHGRPHLDTITIHDLRQSWSEDFPFGDAFLQLWIRRSAAEWFRSFLPCLFCRIPCRLPRLCPSASQCPSNCCHASRRQTASSSRYPATRSS